MFRRHPYPLLSVASPAAPGTQILGSFQGLTRFSVLTVDAILQGATGGTLDLYLQRLVDPVNGIWFDWARYTQLAAAVAAKSYTLSLDPSAAAPTITNVGEWNAAASGTPVLAAGAIVPCHPGDQLRLVAVAGAGTTAGSTQAVYVTGHELYT